MRRLLFSIALVLFVAGRAWSDCLTLTPNLGLAPCTVGTARAISDPAWINNFNLLDLGFTSPLSITGVGSASPSVGLGTVPETKGGTNQTTYIKGDTLSASGTNTLSKISGNTTPTKKFRCQVGNGSAVTTDGWCPGSDVALTTDSIDSLTQFDAGLCGAGQILQESGGTSWVCSTYKPGHIIKDNGTTKTQRTNLNIIGATIADSSGTDSTIVTIGGGGTVFAGGTGTTALSLSADEYFPVFGHAAPVAALFDAQLPVASAGTASKLHCDVDTPPDQIYDLTLFRTSGATALTCSINGTSFCEDNINTVSITAGDSLAFLSHPQATATIAAKARCGFKYN